MKFARGETEEAIKMCMEIVRLGEWLALQVEALVPKELLIWLSLAILPCSSESTWTIPDTGFDLRRVRRQQQIFAGTGSVWGIQREISFW